jgi:hypothetical protein
MFIPCLFHASRDITHGINIGYHSRPSPPNKTRSNLQDMRSALFWDITRRRVIIVYRRFGTTYRSHLRWVAETCRSKWNYCAVVGIIKNVYVKQLHRMCTILSIILFLYRNKFPIRVNCWFCNNKTDVPYGNRNCWDCPNCEQYNGFLPVSYINVY